MIGLGNNRSIWWEYNKIISHFWHQLNRNFCPRWGAGCIDRVDSDCQGVSISTNVVDGIDPTCVELGGEVGWRVVNAAGAGADKNLVSAFLCFRVHSNLTIEMNVGVIVGEIILNPDNHLVGCSGGALLGKADEIADVLKYEEILKVN